MQCAVSRRRGSGRLTGASPPTRRAIEGQQQSGAARGSDANGDAGPHCGNEPRSSCDVGFGHIIHNAAQSGHTERGSEGEGYAGEGELRRSAMCECVRVWCCRWQGRRRTKFTASEPLREHSRLRDRGALPAKPKDEATKQH